MAEPSAAIIRQRIETRRVALNWLREPWGPHRNQNGRRLLVRKQNKPFVSMAEALLGSLADYASVVPSEEMVRGQVLSGEKGRISAKFAGRG